jgi:hypothetical protein
LDRLLKKRIKKRRGLPKKAPPFNFPCEMRSYHQRFAALLFSGSLALATALSSAELINRDRIQSSFQTMQQVRVGILTGQVMQGPTLPVEIGNESSSLPAGGVQLRISRMNSNLVETVVTDSQGRYEVALPEGRYLVTLPRPLSGLMSVKDLPSEVQIQSGHRTQLDIRLDTGIR